MMVIDHTANGTVLNHITGGAGRIVTAAEGFIILSGATVGFVYPRVIARDGLSYAARRLIRRGVIIYVVATATGIMSTAIVLFRTSRLDVFSQHVVEVVTARHPPEDLALGLGLESILAIYAILFILAPITVSLLHFRKTPLLLGLAVIAWSVQEFLPIGYTDAGSDDDIGGLIMRFSVLQGWAVWVVFAALIWHWKRLAPFVARVSLARWAMGSGAVALVCWRVFPAHDSRNVLFEPQKLLICAALFVFFLSVVTLAYPWLVAIVGWLFIPLGQQALVAVALHIVLIAVPQPSLAFLGSWRGMPLQILAVAAVWFGTQLWVGFGRGSPPVADGQPVAALEQGTNLLMAEARRRLAVKGSQVRPKVEAPETDTTLNIQ